MSHINTAEPYKYGFTTDVETEQFPIDKNLVTNGHFKDGKFTPLVEDHMEMHEE